MKPVITRRNPTWEYYSAFWVKSFSSSISARQWLPSFHYYGTL